MNLSDLKTSKFLKKEDVGNGTLLTISHLSRENVAQEGAEPELKPVLFFNGIDKGLVLNSTNGQIIAQITGHDTDIEKTWVGQNIVLYHDPNVSFGGKLVGGIRIRAPRKLPQVQQPLQQQQAAGAYVPQDDGLPF
jgi:hypothetical protein